MNKEDYIIEGGIHNDERGSIAFVNDFNLEEIKRFYRITHKDTTTIRAWQGHQKEQKWFHCIKGSFTIRISKIEDWSNPPSNLGFYTFNLSESESRILHIPAGYINGFKANESNSSLIVFSDKSLDESKNDNFRFDKGRWVDWQ